jgi:hypothetical protein
MALSMEEQRILDEMERKLADADPRLASRLASLGAPGLRGFWRAPGTRILAVVLLLAAIVAVTLVLYAVPFRADTVRRVHAHSSAAPTAAHRPAAG